MRRQANKSKNYESRNEFKTSRKSPMYISSQVSSNVISTLETRGAELIKEVVKEGSNAKIGKNWSITQFSSKKSPRKSSKQTKDRIENHTNGSLSTEFNYEGKNRFTEVSTKMFLQHLKTPIKKEEVFQKVAQVST